MLEIKPNKSIMIWAGKRYCRQGKMGCHFAYLTPFARSHGWSRRKCAIYGERLRETPSGHWRCAQCLRDEIHN